MSGLTRFHAGKCLKKYTLLDGFLKDLVNSPVDMVYHLIIYRFFLHPRWCKSCKISSINSMWQVFNDPIDEFQSPPAESSVQVAVCQ